MNTMKKLTVLLLALILLLSCTALAEVGTIFPWNGYTMNANLITTGDTVNALTNSFRSQKQLDGQLVMVRVTPMSGTVKRDDINTGDFVLRDKDKNEVTTGTVRLPEMNSDGTLGFAEEQPYFDLIYMLGSIPVEALDGGKLAVKGSNGEKILVPLVEIYPDDEEAAPAEEAKLPAELTGKWHGTGIPKNHGTPIDLTAVVNEDGSGEYTFVQGSYTENFSFTLSATDNTFDVSIPATSMLGSVTGTYELADGVLKLDITSTFLKGGSYSYTAECTKEAEEPEEAPAPAEEPQEPAAEAAQAGGNTWICPDCGAENSGSFCPNDATPRPVANRDASFFNDSTWTMRAQFINGQLMNAEEGVITLNADGTATVITEGEKYQVAWYLSGNKIILDVFGTLMELNINLVWEMDGTEQLLEMQ